MWQTSNKHRWDWGANTWEKAVCAHASPVWRACCLTGCGSDWDGKVALEDQLVLGRSPTVAGVQFWLDCTHDNGRKNNYDCFVPLCFYMFKYLMYWNAQKLFINTAAISRVSYNVRTCTTMSHYTSEAQWRWSQVELFKTEKSNWTVKPWFCCVYSSDPLL